MSIKLPTPCVICGYEPEDASGPFNYNQPYNATTFNAHGQYGSTIFDPFDGGISKLELNICDLCLIGLIEKNVVLLGRTIPQPDDYKLTPAIEYWDEEDMDWEKQKEWVKKSREESEKTK